jgi:hypothetical protein
VFREGVDCLREAFKEIIESLMSVIPLGDDQRRGRVPPGTSLNELADWIDGLGVQAPKKKQLVSVIGTLWRHAGEQARTEVISIVTTYLRQEKKYTPPAEVDRKSSVSAETAGTVDLSLGLVTLSRLVAGLKESDKFNQEDILALLRDAVRFHCGTHCQLLGTEQELGLLPLSAALSDDDYVYLRIDFRGPARFASYKSQIEVSRNLPNCEFVLCSKMGVSDLSKFLGFSA